MNETKFGEWLGKNPGVHHRVKSILSVVKPEFFKAAEEELWMLLKEQWEANEMTAAFLGWRR